MQQQKYFTNPALSSFVSNILLIFLYKLPENEYLTRSKANKVRKLGLRAYIEPIKA